MRQRQAFLMVWLVVILCIGCQRKDETGIDSSTGPNNDFLLFPNSHTSLGVGDYTVRFISGTLLSIPTAYRLTVTYTDGTSETYTGNWTGNNQTLTQTIEVKRAGGISVSLDTGTTTATLDLLQAGTSLANASGANPSLSLPRYQVDQVAYAQAYYATIDPTNARTTLADWKTANGFVGNSCDYEVRFRDVLDLGYGRHMCARRDGGTGNIAVWVENFQVTAVPGQNYGPLNLEAVVSDDRRWHIGTNAIEFSPTPTSGGVKFVKFYTFDPDGTRRLLVNLDGKGAKAMPNPCISCHGGTAWPLTAAGLFPAIGAFPRGDTRAQMQALNVDTLDFSTLPGFRRADQEAALKGINQYVLCSYALPLGTPTPTGFAEDVCRSVSTLASQWQGTTAEMVKSWYGGNGMPSATASDTYVPTNWTDVNAGVSGAQNLYQTVVAPYCRVCHALRGNANAPGASDIDFTEFRKFIGTAAPAYEGFPDRILYHVFEQGNMPLALLKYNQFWASSAPATLAAFIPGATNGSGATLTPTRPIAKPGINHTIVTGVSTKLSAAGSINATSFRWRVTSGNVANTVLTDPNTIRPTFTATANGTYTLELIVNNGTTDSAPATLTLAAVASLTDGAGLVTTNDPSILRFSHIRTILQDNTTYFCASCHTHLDASGPPVYYTNYDRNGDTFINAADVHQFYLDVRARINFANIESSRLLVRPSGHHHPGGLLTNFDSSVAPGSAGRGAYDIFLNWILNGAPE